MTDFRPEKSELFFCSLSDVTYGHIVSCNNPIAYSYTFVQTIAKIDKPSYL